MGLVLGGLPASSLSLLCFVVIEEERAGSVSDAQCDFSSDLILLWGFGSCPSLPVPWPHTLIWEGDISQQKAPVHCGQRRLDGVVWRGKSTRERPRWETSG